MAEIQYSMKYIHNSYEYNYVILPPEVSKLLPKNRLLSENEWRAIGVQQSLGWVHYAIHPNIMFFKRPLNQAMLAKSCQVGEINNRSKSEKFTWTIKNFSKSKKLYSEIFFLHGYPWRILIFPKGNNVDFLSIYLVACNIANMAYGWSKFPTFKLALFNQFNGKTTKTKEFKHNFNAREILRGFKSFIPLGELCDPSGGFIVNDTCIVEAEISVSKLTWTIKNFSKLDSKKLYSKNFFLDGHPWRILIFPKGNNVDFLSIYLDAPYGWSRFAYFKLALINQVNGKMTITKETEHLFNERTIDWGFTSFIPLGEFRDSKRGYIVNDTCIITAEISVSKPEQKNQGDQANSEIDVSAGSAQVCAEPIEHTDNPLPREMFSVSFGELMDFRGLGKIERAFVPLLDEVKKRKQNVAGLEMEMKRLKAKMSAVEVDIEIAREDLVEVEEGFEDWDLNAELGYGAP